MQEEDGDISDDEFVPHPWASRESACGHLHFKDDVTERLCVRIREEGEDGEERERVLVVMSGEGIAIGRDGCEFHKY
jgi:hypothetical protein